MLAGPSPQSHTAGTCQRRLGSALAPRRFPAGVAAGIAVGTPGVLLDEAHALGKARIGTAPDFPVFAHQGVIPAGTPVVVHQVHGDHVVVMPMRCVRPGCDSRAPALH